MKTVSIGSSGFQCSHLGFGCMSLGKGAIYAQSGDHTDENGIKIIHTALDNGITHLDTALGYGMGLNEKLVGQAIKGYDRSKIQVATKTGIALGDGGKMVVCGDPAYIRKTCSECLERLDTPYIDLFYIHRIDTKVPIEDTIREMKKLVEEGKIRYIGLSEASASTIRRAHAIHPITAVQLEWSLWSRDSENEVIPTCRELGIGVVVYSPLGGGMLTGALTSAENIKDWRAGSPRFQGENFEKNLEFVRRVTEMAKQKGCTPGQLSLAWVMAQGDDVCPIPGTSNVNHLLENIKASQISLTSEEVEQLKGLIPPGEVAGDRHRADMPTYKDN